LSTLAGRRKIHGTPSKIHFLFVDYENVTQIDFSIFQSQSVHLNVILGANQKKLDTDFVLKLSRYTTQMKLVQLTKTGKNALDFVLAYEVGQKAAANPKACFHVISKDKGFDGLITHLNNGKVRAQRHDDFSRIAFSAPAKTPPSPAVTKPKRVEDLIPTLREYLKKTSRNRPKKKKTLLNFLKSHLGKNSTEDEALRAFESLCQSGNVAVEENDNVSYSL
jgi:hypothetical protein